VNKTFSLEELADAVREWCDQHRIVPANGQAADQVSERNIRYYRTLGLLDAPVGSYVKSFNEKHLLQLLAIRIYQAQGLPLRKIRDELYGKSEEELRQFTRTAAKTGVKLAPAFAPPLGSRKLAGGAAQRGFPVGLPAGSAPARRRGAETKDHAGGSFVA
jgi:MerR HTH family regulatory protein